MASSSSGHVPKEESPHRGPSMMSLEDVPEEGYDEFPRMTDIRGWMANMQRSIERIEKSLLYQSDVMEEVHSKVSSISQRKNSKLQIVPSHSRGSLKGSAATNSSEFQVHRFMTKSMEEMPSMLRGEAESRGSFAPLDPDRDPSIDEISRHKPQQSTKSLGFAGFARRKEKMIALDSERRQSEPDLPPSSPSGFNQQRRNFLRSKSRHATSSQYGAMGELEAATARLLQRDRRRSTQKSETRLPRAGSKETNNSPGVGRRGSSPTPALDRILPSQIHPAPAPASSELDESQDEVKFGESEDEDADPSVDHMPTSRKRVLVRCRRISLEELRDNYDSELVNRQGPGGTHTHHWESTKDQENPEGWFSDDEPSETEVGTALISAARMFLVVVGILDYRDGLFWQLLSFFSILVPAALSISATVTTMMVGADLRAFSTTICYFAGSLLATLSLRRAGVTSLLGPKYRRLDIYADESGFLEDWQRVSLLRLLEVLGLYVVMVSFRVISSVMTTDVSYGKAVTGSLLDILPGLSFSLMSLRLVMVCFCHLHICCGLELAIDSFGLRVFKDMDMERALEEWNLVQATLRQCSGKLSSSMSIMGICCFACLGFLAEQLLNNPELLQNLLQTALWMGWLYPPVVLYAYTMMRAAAVSEKASRVAPLVNSWKFEGAKVKSLMDHDRQYVVQYIIQSEAGFYLKGVRLTAGSVQKMSYYFAAFTFSVFARFWGAT